MDMFVANLKASSSVSKDSTLHTLGIAFEKSYIFLFFHPKQIAYWLM